MGVLTIKYFASIRETLQCAEEQLPWTANLQTVADVRACLQSRGPAWQAALGEGNVRCARNFEHCTLETVVRAEDEIAFFPPVTGG